LGAFHLYVRKFSFKVSVKPSDALDDVPAYRSLKGLGKRSVFLQGKGSILKAPFIAIDAEKSDVAAPRSREIVFGILLGQFFKIGTLLQLLINGIYEGLGVFAFALLGPDGDRAPRVCDSPCRCVWALIFPLQSCLWSR